jgi:outer membrane immunogenic protein
MNLKLIGTGLAALALLAGSLSAQAADIPRPIYKGIRPVAAYYNWTGFYAGINAGYGFGSSTWSDPVGTRIKPKGALFGGTVGYNYQMGSLVYGLEGDFDWSGVKGSTACLPLVLSCETSNRWLATFRGRLGYAFDRWLPYITGGGAYGNVKATATDAFFGTSLTQSKSELGWTFGVGVEYAFMGSWTAKLEYLHVDLGSFTAPEPFASTVNFRENILRAGLNYKFSGPVFSP